MGPHPIVLLMQRRTFLRCPVSHRWRLWRPRQPAANINQMNLARKVGAVTPIFRLLPKRTVVPALSSQRSDRDRTVRAVEEEVGFDGLALEHCQYLARSADQFFHD